MHDPVYDGKKAVLLLQWVRPASGMELHALDLVTIAMPDGTIELLTALYWGDCSNNDSAHTSRGGYMCDVAKEEVACPAPW